VSDDGGHGPRGHGHAAAALVQVVRPRWARHLGDDRRRVFGSLPRALALESDPDDHECMVRLAAGLALTAVFTASLSEVSRGTCSMQAPAARSHDCCAGATDRVQAPCCHARQDKDFASSLTSPVRATSNADTGSRLASAEHSLLAPGTRAVAPGSFPPLIVLRI